MTKTKKTRSVKKTISEKIDNFIQFSKPMIELTEADYSAIRKVIDSGWVSIGKYMEKLEQYFIENYKVKHAIACSSCTQGLIIAMKAAGWRKKRIALPSFTWPSTVFAAESSGNIPIFCDIDPETWLIDLSLLSPKNYDAVVAVDVFGNQAQVKTDKPVIYDAAHGFGLKMLGKRGLAEVVSFSFTKVVTAMDGGMILTDDDEVADIAKELRRLSSRMGEINAVVCLRSLKNYKRNQELKLENIQKYCELLSFEYTIQKIPVVTNHSVFSIVLPNQQMRDAIIKAFEENDIEVKAYYEPLVGGLPNTDSVFARIISFPIYPAVKDHIAKICDIANNAVAGTVDKYVQGKRYLVKSKYLTGYIQTAR
ncbi:MAG: DegT/DnrJ/EryC1/StrS family aminotransferase [Candidatus Shapirobacteria bacterium]